MTIKRFSRPLAMLASVLLAATFGAVVGTVEAARTPTAAHASVVGGAISRTEILSRAQWWVNTYGVIYSQNQANAKPSVTGERYRPDCSGFVSMAWRLPKKSDGWDRNTGDLADFGDTIWLSSLNDLRPGDAILGVSYGHVALFDRWTDSSKTAMWIYDEFSSSAQGRHDVQSKSWYANNGFRGLRYKKAIDGTGSSSHDFDGDGHADVIGRNTANNELYLYRGNGSTLLSGTVIGYNWGSMDTIFSPGDFDGDGHADVIGRNTANNELYLYRGNGSSLLSGTVIGYNWGGMNAIF